MIRVDCSELSGDLKLALACTISEKLEGTGIGVLKGNNIVVDQLPGRKVETSELQLLVKEILQERQDASIYRVEGKGEVIIIHSAELVTADRKKVTSRLPPGFIQCPVCGFVTTSEAKFSDHTRLHDLMRGLAR